MWDCSGSWNGGMEVRSSGLLDRIIRQQDTITGRLREPCSLQPEPVPSARVPIASYAPESPWLTTGSADVSTLPVVSPPPTPGSSWQTEADGSTSRHAPLVNPPEVRGSETNPGLDGNPSPANKRRKVNNPMRTVLLDNGRSISFKAADLLDPPLLDYSKSIAQLVLDWDLWASYVLEAKGVWWMCTLSNSPLHDPIYSSSSLPGDALAASKDFGHASPIGGNTLATRRSKTSSGRNVENVTDNKRKLPGPNSAPTCKATPLFATRKAPSSLFTSRSKS